MLRQVRQRFLDALVFRVSLDIHEKVIFPCLGLARSAFDLGHVDAVFFESRQRVVQRADLVFHGKEHGRLVVAGRLAETFGDHKEARRVAAEVLHIPIEDVQAVQFGRERARQGGAFGLAGRHFSASGRAGHRDQRNARHVLAQPAPTLPENLRLAVDSPDLLAWNIRHQRVGYRQVNLRADFQGRVRELVQRVRHRAIRRIFDRHNTVIRAFLFNRVENVADGFAIRVLARSLRIAGARPGA